MSGVRAEPTAAAAAGVRDTRALTAVAVLLVLVLALAVRLWGLGERGLTHPEIYIPGVDLAPGFSEPPPRHGFVETLAWHFEFEPHPFGYYMAMWGWTKLAGASAFAIRLPEAILGALSVVLLFLLGRQTYGARAGLIAAALLALSGFHIYWSQSARMYAPGALLGLAATLLFIRIVRAERPPRALMAAYCAVVLAAALTVEFTWPLLGVHLAWAVLRQRPPAAGIALPVFLVTLAGLLAAPMLAHAAIGARGEAAPPPGLAFLRDWLSFGFLFEGGVTKFPAPIPDAVRLAAFAAGAVLTGLGLTLPAEPAGGTAPAAGRWLAPLALASLAGFLVIVGFVAILDHPRKALLATLALPWLALAVPPLATLAGRGIDRLPAPLRTALREGRLTQLVPLLALLPVFALFLASFKVPVTAPRAFLMFVPYLLLLAGAGLDRLWRWPAAGALASAGLAALFAFSIVAADRLPPPRDYQGLGRALAARLAPGDRILLPRADWRYTPVTVYLPHDRLLAAGDPAALAAAAPRRIWLVQFEDGIRKPGRPALAGFAEAGEVRAHNGRAILFEAAP